MPAGFGVGLRTGIGVVALDTRSGVEMGAEIPYLRPRNRSYVTWSLKVVPSGVSMIRSRAFAPSKATLGLLHVGSRKISAQCQLENATIRPPADSVCRPEVSAQPASPPSAALVIRLTVSPESQMPACARQV